jgi:Ca2+-binding RTX toxin-like protein
LGRGLDIGHGAQGNDVVRGGSGDDFLGGLPRSGAGGSEWSYELGRGEEGDDQHFGGPGNDHIMFGLGDDIVDGGGDRDEANLYLRRKKIEFRADLASETASGVGTDSMNGIEDLTAFARGSITLSGNDDENQLIGGSSQSTGPTTFFGGGGDDLLHVDPGVNLGEAAPATLHGGPGNDLLEGGCTSSIAVPDELFGEEGNDALDGGCGTELLNGGPGDDILKVSGDEGADTVDGGSDLDTAQFGRWGQWAEVDLSLGQGAIFYDDGGKSAVASLIGIENVTGHPNECCTPTVGDVLIGDEGANVIMGLGGDDAISGGDGDDSLAGGEGNDQLDGGSGTNANDGGAGTDFCVNPNAAQGGINCEQP